MENIDPNVQDQTQKNQGTLWSTKEDRCRKVIGLDSGRFILFNLMDKLILKFNFSSFAVNNSTF